jgi:hypothetical protein
MNQVPVIINHDLPNINDNITKHGWNQNEKKRENHSKEKTRYHN